MTKVPNTITYRNALANCKSGGRELCTSKAICKDGKTPYQGVVSGDHWVPIKDSFNEWIQIGKCNNLYIRKKFWTDYHI